MCDDELILRGPEDEKHTPVVSLGEFYLGRLQEHGNRVALVQEVGDHDVTSVTYWQLLRHGKVVAGLLREYNLDVEDTVMLCCGNTLEFVPVMLGTFFVGSALAPINPAFDTHDLLHALNIINPKLVICNRQSEACVQEALTLHMGRVSLITLAAVKERLDRNHHQYIKDFHLGYVEDPDKHVAMLLCSSGTTGKQKEVEITDYRFLHLMYNPFFPRTRDADEQHVSLNTSGPYWVSCHLMTLYSLCSGYKLVLMETFREDNYLRLVQKFHINLVILGPEQLVPLAKYAFADSFNLSSLRTVLYGGAPMSCAMLNAAQNNLKHNIVVVYGMTECTGIFTPDFDAVGKIGNVGKLAARVEAKVVDLESGAPAGPNREGELCFKTAVFFKGYRGNPQATSDMYDDAGFLRTGDVGYYDQDGYFFVVDRCKDIFKYGGIHVSGVEIEEVLLQHPGVQDAAVVGLRHETDCARATAFVVRTPEVPVTRTLLIDLVKDNLPTYKWLYGGLHFVDSIPRTSSGKIQKYKLRKQYEDQLEDED